MTDMLLRRSFSCMLHMLLLTASCSPLVLQAAPIPVRSVKKDARGVTLKLESGTLRVLVCSESIVRVVYSPIDSLPMPESFVVTHKWEPISFQQSESIDAVTISTSKLTVKVAKGSGAITFLDRTGKTLLQEPANGGKTMTAAKVNEEQSWHVEQSFECPPDEALYGMGQFQDGIWNWRGIPLELRQHNTQIAAPMLVSSKGEPGENPTLLGVSRKLSPFHDFREPLLHAHQVSGARRQSGGTQIGVRWRWARVNVNQGIERLLIIARLDEGTSKEEVR